MKKRIELREITTLPSHNVQGVCICSDEFCESIKATRSIIKKAKAIADTMDTTCVAFGYAGSKMYAVSESCTYLNRFIIFNAAESKSEYDGLHVFVRDPLTSGRLFDKWIHYMKGEIL